MKTQTKKDIVSVIIGLGGPLFLWGLYQLIFRFLLDWPLGKYQEVGFGYNWGWLCFVLVTVWIWYSIIRIIYRRLIRLFAFESRMTWQLRAITIISSFFFAGFAAFAVNANNTFGAVHEAMGTIAEKSIYKKPSVTGQRTIFHIRIEWKKDDKDIFKLCAVDSADYKALSVGERIHIKYQRGLLGLYCYIKVVTESGFIIRDFEKNEFSADRGVRP